jgi:hypothetical protein
MKTFFKRLGRDNAGDGVVGYLLLAGLLAGGVMYFGPAVFTAITNSSPTTTSYTTAGVACSQTDQTAGAFAQLTHAANCQ